MFESFVAFMDKHFIVIFLFFIICVFDEVFTRMCFQKLIKENKYLEYQLQRERELSEGLLQQLGGRLIDSETI